MIRDQVTEHDIPRQHIQLERDAILYHMGDEAQYPYRVRWGSVKIIIIGSDVAYSAIDLVKTGSVFCE